MEEAERAGEVEMNYVGYLLAITKTRRPIVDTGRLDLYQLDFFIIS